MRLKQDKYLIVQEVQSRVESSLKSSLDSYYFNGRKSLEEIQRHLITAISSAVADGVSTAIDNLYTDEDFEKDVGLTG